MNFEVGDWIRFYQAGMMVIGEIKHISTQPTTGFLMFETTCGVTNEKGVLELRKKVV